MNEAFLEKIIGHVLLFAVFVDRSAMDETSHRRSENRRRRHAFVMYDGCDCVYLLLNNWLLVQKYWQYFIRSSSASLNVDRATRTLDLMRRDSRQWSWVQRRTYSALESDDWNEDTKDERMVRGWLWSLTVGVDRTAVKSKKTRHVAIMKRATIVDCMVMRSVFSACDRMSAVHFQTLYL